jgi:hypothetical protein
MRSLTGLDEGGLDRLDCLDAWLAWTTLIAWMLGWPEPLACGSGKLGQSDYSKGCKGRHSGNISLRPVRLTRLFLHIGACHEARLNISYSKACNCAGFDLPIEQKGINSCNNASFFLRKPVYREKRPEMPVLLQEFHVKSPVVAEKTALLQECCWLRRQRVEVTTTIRLIGPRPDP